MTREQAPLLSLRNVVYAYPDEEPALRGISMEIRRGERIAVLGNNGAGKSTFFLVCNGILRPQEGSLSFSGEEIRYTKKDLTALREEFLAKAREEIRLTRLAIEEEDLDVLFAYFSTTDGIQHDFWRHCDPAHPAFPGPNPHQNVIRDMYILMDQYVGEVMERQPGTPLLIVSDHGHGARPVYTVRINELLRRGGYLTPRGGGSGSVPSVKKAAKKALKKTALGEVKQVGLPKWAMKLAKKFPGGRAFLLPAPTLTGTKPGPISAICLP